MSEWVMTRAKVCRPISPRVVDAVSTAVEGVATGQRAEMLSALWLFMVRHQRPGTRWCIVSPSVFAERTGIGREAWWEAIAELHQAGFVEAHDERLRDRGPGWVWCRLTPLKGLRRARAPRLWRRKRVPAIAGLSGALPV